MDSSVLYQFPGQGSHFLGMGKDLWESDNSFFGRLLEVASDYLKHDLSIYISGDVSEGFIQAANLQPLISSVSLAYWDLLKKEGIEPDIVMGHSLGEITALAPAGVVSPEFAVEMAAFRGELMDYSAELCGGGGMAVVLFSSEEDVQQGIREFGLSESLFIANYNAVNQIVISGLTASLQLFADKFCTGRRAKIQKIDVAGPWHTPFVAPGREKFVEWVLKKEFSNPQKRFILNGTADFAQPADDLRIRVADQLVKPVYWSSSLKKAVEQTDKNRTMVLEIGPGKILTGLLRANRIQKHFSAVGSVNSLSAIADVVDLYGQHIEARGE